MMRHITITSRATLFVTALMGVVAISQTDVSRDSALSAIGDMPKAVTDWAVELTSDMDIAQLSPVQTTVLLEGFDWQALVDVANSRSQPSAPARKAPA
ncbi:hypothetical protein [Burkholderia sp. WSM2230]|uniref:hypothetical protein n=1 Tax=Burkholderia sp. WSM2230 TaxID=944435 RepID=UPI00046F4D24|nr:hypothetical protein [Burkholderia sp. WSM2230]